MDTLKLTTLFNILGFYLQGCTMLLGIYTFNRQSMVFKEYILTSVLMTILTYTVNLLPISMGVKIIINMLMLYLMCITLLKMPPYKTIRSTSLSFDLLLLCEMIVTAVMVKISGQEQFEILLNHPIQRNFFGLLSNTLLFISIILIDSTLGRNSKEDIEVYSSIIDHVKEKDNTNF